MEQKFLFDRKLLRQNRKRAIKNYSHHNFLYHEVANRIIENLQMLDKKFDSVLEINCRDAFFLDSISATKKIAIDLVNQNSQQNFAISDEEFLPFAPHSFDLVASNLNLHHINLLPEFLLQIKQILKPDGVFIASFFGEENLYNLRKIIFEAEQEIYGAVSPRIMPTIDVKTIASLLQKSGFSDVVSSVEKINVSYESPISLLKDLKMMAQGNVLRNRSKKFFSKTLLNKVLKQIEESKIEADFNVVSVVGKA